MKSGQIIILLMLHRQALISEIRNAVKESFPRRMAELQLLGFVDKNNELTRTGLDKITDLLRAM